MARTAGALLAALVTVALVGCQTVQPSANVGLQRQSGQAREALYRIDWWASVGDRLTLPYKPLESATPELDPVTGRVFVTTSEGVVHALDSAGKPLWEFRANGPFDAGPTFHGGKLYAGNSEGRLVCLDAASGKLVWEYVAGEELVTRPVVAEGLVLVMSAADTLFAVDAAGGQWRWQYRRDVPVELTLRGAARPLVRDGMVYAGFGDGSAVALAASDGVPQWVRQLASGGRFLDVDADPQADEFGHVFFASFRTGAFALNAETGEPLWNVAEPGLNQLVFDEAEGRLFAGGAGKVLSIQAEQGQVTWRSEMAERTATGMALTNRLLLVSTGPNPMLFLDAGTGALRRMFDPGKGVTARPYTLGNTAFILSNRANVFAMDVLGRGSR